MRFNINGWRATRSNIESIAYHSHAYAPEHNPHEYLNNDLKQTIKTKPIRAMTRGDLVVASSSILKSILKRPDPSQPRFYREEHCERSVS